MTQRAETWILGLDRAAGWMAELEEVVTASPRLRVRRSSIETATERSFEFQLELLLSGRRPRLLVLVMSGEQTGDATELLRCLQARPLSPPVVAAIDRGQPEQILEILEAGAVDFITPPLARSEVLPRLWRILDRAAVAPPVKLKQQLKEKIGCRQLLGESPVFRHEIGKIPMVSKCDVSVLICGETGTGKDLVASAIHYLSPRASHPFVAVNCGGIPVDLLENELFGHRRAAFTGATTSAPGLIREAEGGTLFLDEIDAMPPAAQVKLMRFLQDKQYRPLGSAALRQADVRVLAATNVDPLKAVEQGVLRRDLYYRVNVVQLTLPPLRQRSEDIPLLARHFLKKYAHRFGRSLSDLTPNAVQRLLIHRWPGNVRELEHVIERAVVLCGHDHLLRQGDLELPGGAGSSRSLSFREAKAKVIAGFERNYVGNLLRIHAGNITQAARAAQKDRKSFWQLMSKHGIDARSFKR